MLLARSRKLPIQERPESESRLPDCKRLADFGRIGSYVASLLRLLDFASKLPLSGVGQRHQALQIAYTNETTPEAIAQTRVSPNRPSARPSGAQ